MKRVILPIVAVLAASVHAVASALPASFDARVQVAREAEVDERFKIYKAAMIRRSGRHLARTMRSCRAVAPAPDQKSVVLVADIGADGRATAVEARPDNAIGQCFAKGFASGRYPKPPAYPARPGFPVSMKISVAR